MGLGKMFRDWMGVDERGTVIAEPEVAYEFDVTIPYSNQQIFDQDLVYMVAEHDLETEAVHLTVWDWMEANCKGKWDTMYDPLEEESVWLFEERDDALLFKLTYGGQC